MSLWLNFILGCVYSFCGALISCASVAALFAYAVRSVKWREVKWTSAVHTILRDMHLCWLVVTWYAKTFPRGINRLHQVNAVIDVVESTPYKVYNRFVPFMYIDKPEDLQILLNHSDALEKSDVYKLLGAIGADSLTAVAVSKWKRHRRVLMPFFCTDKLKTYSQPLYERGVLKLGELQTWADTEKVFNLWDFLSGLNVEMTTETLMGLNPETSFTESERETFNRDIQGITKRIMHRVMHVWLHLDILYAGVEKLNGWSQLTKRVYRYWEKLIQCRREILRETSGKGMSQHNDVHLLDALLTLHTPDGNGTSKALIQDIGFIYTAGSETSGLSECFTLLMLAMNPRIQDQVCEEINQVLGTEDKEKPITVEDVENMPLLDRCIKESLRLFPIVPLIARRVTSTMKLSNGEVAEKDMNVLISLYHLHRKSEVYDNPLIFDPDHFLPEKEQQRHPYSYLPFSAGPRGCIGRKYAILSIKLLLAKMLREYRFTTDMEMGDLKYNLDIVLRSVDGWKVKIYTRR